MLSPHRAGWGGPPHRRTRRVPSTRQERPPQTSHRRSEPAALQTRRRSANGLPAEGGPASAVPRRDRSPAHQTMDRGSGTGWRPPPVSENDRELYVFCRRGSGPPPPPPRAHPTVVASMCRVCLRWLRVLRIAVDCGVCLLRSAASMCLRV